MTFSRTQFSILILLLLFSRMGALVHAAEHGFEEDHDYCEICALEHQSADLSTCNAAVGQSLQPLSSESIQHQFYPTSLGWNCLSRAPPVILIA